MVFAISPATAHVRSTRVKKTVRSLFRAIRDREGFHMPIEELPNMNRVKVVQTRVL